MAPGDAWKKQVSYDKMVNDLRNVLKDERIGTVAPAEPERNPEPKPAPARSTNRGNRRRLRTRTNKAKAKATPHGDPDSDCEMRVVCTTDLTGEIAKEAAKNKENAGRNRSTAMAVKLDAEISKNLCLKRGEKADGDLAFVPWRFLIRYAELYVGKTNTPIVEPYFDNEAIFDNQIWDFFYLYEPEDLNITPVLFVPTSQLEALLRKINEKHGIALKLPDGGHSKFIYKFRCQATPKPRYLGRTTLDAASFKTLFDLFPLPDAEDKVSFQGMDQAERDGFAKMLKRVKDSWDYTKGDGKARKTKNAFKRYESRKAWGHTTKRVQRYLGLREKAAPTNNMQDGVGQDSGPAQRPVLDLESPVPFVCEDDVVFICFDIETFERIPKLVTEIGYATLDTRDIRHVAPGQDGRNWFPYIQGRHFRVKEYRRYKNREFVQGCPEFFQFGKSEFIGLADVKSICLEVMTPKKPSGEYRKVVVVGHDVAQDVDLILTVDIDVYDLPGLAEIVDNQRLQQHRKRFPNPQGLSGVLIDLEIDHFYLHNAGNDAVYTLQSMLAHSARMRVDSLAKPPKPKPNGSSRARPYFIDPVEDAGWSTGGEDTDGDVAPPQEDPLAMAKGKAPWVTAEE